MTLWEKIKNKLKCSFFFIKKVVIVIVKIIFDDISGRYYIKSVDLYWYDINRQYDYNKKNYLEEINFRKIRF